MPVEKISKTVTGNKYTGRDQQGGERTLTVFDDMTFALYLGGAVTDSGRVVAIEECNFSPEMYGFKRIDDTNPVCTRFDLEFGGDPDCSPWMVKYCEEYGALVVE